MISSYKRCSVHLYLQSSVGVLMFYLRYLCLLAHSGVQHILCYDFLLFFVVLCTLSCHFLWIVHLWLPLRYSLRLLRKKTHTQSKILTQIIKLKLNFTKQKYGREMMLSSERSCTWSIDFHSVSTVFWLVCELLWRCETLCFSFD